MNIISTLKKIHLGLTDSAVLRYHDERAALNNAPFSMSLYRDRLLSFQAMGLSFPNFIETPKSQTARVYVRHDVDTQECINNIERVVNVDQELGVPSSVYFRVDDEDYKFADYPEIVQRIAKAGFEVGLHTSCYSDNDPIEKFKLETEKFEVESGIKPTSFTLHGLGRQHFANRIKFRNYAGRNLDKFGYEFTDCLSSIRRYRYVIEDCHISPQTDERFIYDDFEKIPEELTQKGNLLVLTHPCYWTP